MQNIFETKKINYLMRCAFAVIAVIVAVSVLVPLKVLDKSFAEQDNAEKIMYLSTPLPGIESKTPSTTDSMPTMTAEMNNIPTKNSKLYSSEFFEQPFDGLDSTVVKVLFPDGNVKNMELEYYILGCVLGEMPLDFELQALMAQSVAVRSFTARRMLYGTPKHKNADVCTDYNCCQCYKPLKSVKLSKEQYNKLVCSVSMTRGVVATYDCQPIEAAYHASSGECTLDSEDVWGGRVEYLRSVKSPEGETDIYENGYGHRVGMSQHGANLLAKEGLGYVEILKYYYSGISLGFI